MEVVRAHLQSSIRRGCQASCFNMDQIVSQFAGALEVSGASHSVRRRCLAPADWFYEWPVVNGEKQARPFLFKSERSRRPRRER